MPFIHKAHEIHHAVQWWKDGDHPNVEMVDYAMKTECKLCPRPLGEHGIIYISVDGARCPLRLCPGSWIVTMEEASEPETYSQELFNVTFLWRPEPDGGAEQPAAKVPIRDLLEVHREDIVRAVTEAIRETPGRTPTTERSKAYSRCFRCDKKLLPGRYRCPHCDGMFCPAHIDPTLHFPTDRPGVTCASHYVNAEVRARELHQVQQEVDDLMHGENLGEQGEEQCGGPSIAEQHCMAVEALEVKRIQLAQATIALRAYNRMLPSGDELACLRCGSKISRRTVVICKACGGVFCDGCGDRSVHVSLVPPFGTCCNSEAHV